eukprot:6856233-Prymnesium_polylepis.1
MMRLRSLLRVSGVTATPLRLVVEWCSAMCIECSEFSLKFGRDLEGGDVLALCGAATRGGGC